MMINFTVAEKRVPLQPVVDLIVEKVAKHKLSRHSIQELLGVTVEEVKVGITDASLVVTTLFCVNKKIILTLGLVWVLILYHIWGLGSVIMNTCNRINRVTFHWV
jgi:hypothetical protein